METIELTDAGEAASRPALRLLLVALAVDSFWAAAYVAAAAAGQQGTRLFKVFDLDLEGNLPTWWSSSQLLLIGIVLLVLALRPFAQHPLIRPLRAALASAGTLFVYFSADEAGAIHERISGLLRGYRFVPSFHGNGVWIFLYAAIGVFSLWALRRYGVPAWRTWTAQCRTALAGWALLVLGGTAFEILGYLWRPVAAVAYVQVAAEELAEMMGASLILFAAVSVLATVARGTLAAPSAEGTHVREEAG